LWTCGQGQKNSKTDLSQSRHGKKPAHTVLRQHHHHQKKNLIVFFRIHRAYWGKRGGEILYGNLVKNIVSTAGPIARIGAKMQRQTRTTDNESPFQVSKEMICAMEEVFTVQA
jgi:hypothetical protein